MSKYKIIEPIPGTRGVQVLEQWLTDRQAKALAQDPMRIVLRVTNRLIEKVG